MKDVFQRYNNHAIYFVTENRILIICAFSISLSPKESL
nr:MAG TPA: hypothetical protein [Caudoviricetes sp.]